MVALLGLMGNYLFEAYVDELLLSTRSQRWTAERMAVLHTERDP